MRGMLRLIYSSYLRKQSRSRDTAILKERQEIKKSNVRICVTYIATTFIFGGGIGLILFFTLFKKEPDLAMRVFNAVLPIATGIVTYWFATRSNKK